MKKLIIEGGNTLTGTIKIGGAKNSVVALIPAAMLTDKKVIIENVPNISDLKILKYLLNMLIALELHIILWEHCYQDIRVLKYLFLVDV